VNICVSKIHITLVQTSILWEDPVANCLRLKKQLAQLPEPTQLIVLPEMFATGFSMNTQKIGETMLGPTVGWMQQQANALNAILTGSVCIEEEGRYYNRLIWALPNGKLWYYDKRHLFGLAKENQYYTGGKERVIAQINGMRVNLQVCYDLRFPVWCRQQSPEEFDILLYVANWPSKRMLAWKTLLQARAIENQCYVIGVNRVGEDENGLLYDGHSTLIHPNGEILYQKSEEEDIYQATLHKQAVMDTRNQLPFLQDQDDFRIL
jgi:omega-amidase